MPRIARGLGDNCVYHVLNRGNGRGDVFHSSRDYEASLEIVKDAKDRYAVGILAYCLMPNHFHMVLVPERGEYLSKWMQWVMTSHVRKYHRQYGGSGHVWQGRYKSFLVQSDSHLLTVLGYIEGNPVRANIVGSAKAWRWSSHRENAGIVKKSLVDELPLELPQEWSRYVDEPLTEGEMEKLRISVNRQAPYGESAWQRKVCAALGLESTMRRRGRPCKSEKEQRK
ncbi:MAG TPA: transposase [Syntrophales bacterium]|nr:transposase [Syntrophales bacterium]